MNNFTFSITEHIATIGQTESTTTEVNKVSWNGKQPKTDIRVWSNKDGQKQPYKGISLCDTEVQALYDVLKALNEK